ncbi:MAG: hypothetical protein R2941_02060 [Desulfobacterales bacterium]
MGNAKKGCAEKIVRLMAVCFFVTVLFAGCGGGGDSEPVVSEGRFVDSPVAGLEYKTESRSGITDSDGKFSYLDGEMISFTIGDIYLGKTLAKPVITPLDLVDGAADETDASVTNICRFLQTLDDDGNPDNGIVINESVRRGASGVSVNFSTDVSAFGTDAETQQAVLSLTAFTSAGQRPLQNAEQARQHFRLSLGISDDSGSDDSELAENEEAASENPESDTGSEVAQSETGTAEPETNPDVPKIESEPTESDAGSEIGQNEIGAEDETNTSESAANTENSSTNTENADENASSGNTNETPSISETLPSESVSDPQSADNTGTNTGENTSGSDSENKQSSDNAGNTGNTDTGSTGEDSAVTDSGNTQSSDNAGNTGSTDTGSTGEDSTGTDSGNAQPTDNTGNTGNTDTELSSTGEDSAVTDSRNTQSSDNAEIRATQIQASPVRIPL